MLKIIKRLLTKKSVIKRYQRAGMKFACATYLIPHGGRCIGYNEILLKFIEWEIEYATRGYKPLTIETFTSHVNEENHPFLPVITRNAGEKIVLYATLYMEAMRKADRGNLQPKKTGT